MLPVIIVLICVAIAVWLAILYSGSRDRLRLQTERNEQLQQEKRVFFDFLHDLGDAFNEKTDRQELGQIIITCVTKVTSARSGALYFLDHKGQKLKATAVTGMFPPPFSLPKEVVDKVSTREEHLRQLLKNEDLPLDGGSFLARVCKSEEPVMIQQAGENEGYPVHGEKAIELRSLIAIPLLYRGQKLGLLAVANHLNGTPFTESDFEIAKSVADQAAFSIHNAAVFSQLAEKERLDRDLDTAREIQQILLPKDRPVLPGYEIAATNIPALQVSGDYFDFLRIDDTHLGLVIADVSGKGVPASLIMAMCRTVMRTQAIGQSSAAAVLRQANRLLHPDIRKDMFITMVYMILDTANHTLTLAKAGHDAPLLVSGDGERIDPLQSPGLALGIDSGEVFDKVCKDLIVHLNPKDTVLVYTDGINEAVDQEGQEFGREQVKSALVNASSGGPDFLIHNIVERVSRFRGDQIQNDDITLLALQRK
jgi:sigma-B regulation protein RsbU (phosphoserine phosphatase)